ncbi:MAG TPA: hypothetical protein ENH84_00445 [Phycisphaerae bacterium]|nr:hypothetical protein [Phycisphaerae bacterium]
MVLRRADTWRYRNAQEFMRHRREEAARRRKQNEKAGDEKVAAAVDSLPSKNLREFIDVERSRHTGETVISHGPDQAFLERSLAREKKEAAQVENEAAINPGHHPKTIYRERRN